MYSINVTGYIPKQKLKEFRQHMKQLIVQQNEEDIQLSVLKDMINEDLYQVKAAFSDKQRMFSFVNSDDYAMISGSFKVLGMLREKYFTEFSNLNEPDKTNVDSDEK